jgi:hypothetical protein
VTAGVVTATRRLLAIALTRQEFEPLEQLVGYPGRIGHSGRGAGRSDIGGPVLWPQSGDQVAGIIEQVRQAGQYSWTVVGVGVLAQLTQPQDRGSRTPVSSPSFSARGSSG